MQSIKAATLDERISSDPELRTEFVIYVYYQYNENLTMEDVSSSMEAILQAKEAVFQEGSLAQAVFSSVLGKGSSGNRFSKEEAFGALGKMKIEIDAAKREGHDFLSDLVIRDYLIFERYLLGAYVEFMNRTSSLASVHNYLDAEMEVYRAACFCFPGVRKHADEVFGKVYREPSAAGGAEGEKVRRIEFLQWFVGQYVIPAVDSVPSEWYYTHFRRHLNQRVLPIFRNVLQQRRSVFVVSSRSKNGVVLNDVLYAENFNVKMTDADALEKGNVVECTIIRHASSSRINSIVRLISPDEAEKVLADVNSRRQLMTEVHSSFIASFGSESLVAGSPQEAIAAYSTFIGKYSRDRGMSDSGLPKLVNAEVFNSHQEFRAALLCEMNNFYLSIYYPMLMDALEGRMNRNSAAEITDICLTNGIALPFTTLKRLIARHGPRLLEFESIIRPEVGSMEELRSLVMRERGHSWEYTPVTLVSGSPPAGGLSGSSGN